MGLHNIITAPPPERNRLVFRLGDDPEDDPEDAQPYSGQEEAGVCPQCGSRFWNMVEYGSYSQDIYVNFFNSHRREYESMEAQEVHDDSGWTCESGHEPTEIISDILYETS